MYSPSHPLSLSVTGSLLREAPLTIYGYLSETKPPFLHQRQPHL